MLCLRPYSIGPNSAVTVSSPIFGTSCDELFVFRFPLVLLFAELVDAAPAPRPEVEAFEVEAAAVLVDVEATARDFELEAPFDRSCCSSALN